MVYLSERLKGILHDQSKIVKFNVLETIASITG